VRSTEKNLPVLARVTNPGYLSPCCIRWEKMQLQKKEGCRQKKGDKIRSAKGKEEKTISRNRDTFCLRRIFWWGEKGTCARTKRNSRIVRGRQEPDSTIPLKKKGGRKPHTGEKQNSIFAVEDEGTSHQLVLHWPGESGKGSSQNKKKGASADIGTAVKRKRNFNPAV